MADRVFGEIEGIPAGTSFATRKEAAAAGIHKPLQAGISGSKDEGSDSIVIQVATRMTLIAAMKLFTPAKVGKMTRVVI
jgi:hypothetical protein